MTKVKSAVALILSTILILGLCFICTVSFSYGVDNMNTFNSVVSRMAKDANIGNSYASGERYVGGGYSAVYYPKGVISAQEYSDNLEGLTDAAQADPDNAEKAEAVTEYTENHVRYPDENGALYLEKETVYGKDGTEISEEFKTEFQNALSLVRNRVERLHVEGAKVSVRDDYSIAVALPAYSDATAIALNYFAYTGDFMLKYGSDAASATPITLAKGETIRDYVRGARYMAGNNSAAVVVDFTGKGKKVLSGWTDTAAETAVTLYFYVGENTVISLSVNEKIDSSTLYISGNYTEGSAKAVALTMDSAINGEKTDLTFTVGDTIRREAQFGNLALTLLFAAFGALYLGLAVFFFVRYRALGFVFLYSSLLWLFSMILLVWAIPFLHLGVETFIAAALAAVLLAVTTVMTYESVKKEYAFGRTMAASLKTGYKRVLLPVLDVHVVLALISFITFFIALTELRVFAFTFGLGVVLSFLAFALGRFFWSVFMIYAKDKGKFCNFKREDSDDE